MAKQGALGARFAIAGFDISGDVSSIDQMSSPTGVFDVTGLPSYGHERIYGLRDADWQITTFFNITAGQEHPALSQLPRGDAVACFQLSSTLQDVAAAISAKQINYDPTRDNTGALNLKTELKANGYGMEWGESLTAGWRTDTAATAGPFIDDTAGTAFGGQAYFQLVSFTGTSVTIDIQSATTSGGSYATTGLTSQAFTGIGAQRVAVANTTTISRYLKVVTTGTFTVAKFLVVFNRNKISGVVF